MSCTSCPLGATSVRVWQALQLHGKLVAATIECKQDTLRRLGGNELSQPFSLAWRPFSPFCMERCCVQMQDIVSHGKLVPDELIFEVCVGVWGGWVRGWIVGPGCLCPLDCLSSRKEGMDRMHMVGNVHD